MGKEAIDIVNNDVQTNNVTKEKYNRLLEELGELEKKLFGNSDGKIGGDSKDTKIDELFESEIKKAKDIKAQIQLLSQLIWFFDAENSTKNLFEKQDYKDLISKYPKHKEIIDSFILKEGETSQVNESFFDTINKVLEHCSGNDRLNFLIGHTGKYNWKTVFEEYFNYFYYNDKSVVQLEEIKKWSIAEITINEAIKNNTEGFYIDKIINYNFINILDRKEENGYLLTGDIIKLYNSLGGFLDEFEKVFLEEYRKENPDFSKLYDVILKIKDVDLRSKFIYKITKYSDTMKGFEDYYHKRRKEESFKFLDDVKGLDEHKIGKYTKYLSYMTKYEIKIVEPLIKEIFKNAGNEEKQRNIFEGFINKFKESKIIITNNSFYVLISQIGKDFPGNNKELSSKMMDLGVNLREDSLNKIKKNIGKINIGDGKDEEYKKICNEYTQIPREEAPNFRDYLRTCIVGNKTPLEEKTIDEIFKTVIGIPPGERKLPPEKKGTNSELAKKHGKQMDELIKYGAKIDENGNLEISSPIKLGRNQTIKMGQDGELIYMNSLGYTFKFDKDLNKSADKLFEIKSQIEFFDTVGFGYFGEDFKEMIEIIKSTGALIGSDSQISISENIGNGNDFLNIRESIKLCNIFKKIGFLEDHVDPNNLSNIPMQKTEFAYKIQNLGEKYGENNFYPNGKLNKVAFKKALIDIYSK